MRLNDYHVFWVSYNKQEYLLHVTTESTFGVPDHRNGLQAPS